MPRRWMLASIVVFGLPLSASAASKLEIQRSLVAAANEHGVPVSLALAVARVESGFDGTALSNKGARGVMQIMPATALGEFMVPADKLWDAHLNSQLGVQYLRRLYDNYGRWDLALSHYNGGTVKGDTPSSYTVDYVNSVQAWQQHYQGKGCDRLTTKRMNTHADAAAICLDGTVTAANLAPAPESRKTALLEQMQPLPAPTIAPPVSAGKLEVLRLPSQAPSEQEPPPPTAAPRPTVQAGALGDKPIIAAAAAVAPKPPAAAPAPAPTPAAAAPPPVTPPAPQKQLAALQPPAFDIGDDGDDDAVPEIPPPRTAATVQATPQAPARAVTQPVARARQAVPRQVVVADIHVPAPPPRAGWYAPPAPQFRMPPPRFGRGGPAMGPWHSRPGPWR